jgi:predicted O-methyltransferase YrrM
MQRAAVSLRVRVERARAAAVARIDLKLANRILPNREALMSAKQDLRPAYDEYVRSVSSPEMAGSLSTIALLTELCELRRPRVVLDAGSGFSTFALCRWRADVVISIDDSVEWRGKTSEFLERNNVALPRQLGGLELFDGLPQLDIAFLDLAFPDESRARWVGPILDALSPGGIVVFDDTHQASYRRLLRRECAGRDFLILSLRRLTLDAFGRYASAGVGVGSLDGPRIES